MWVIICPEIIAGVVLLSLYLACPDDLGLAFGWLFPTTPGPGHNGGPPLEDSGSPGSGQDGPGAGPGGGWPPGFGPLVGVGIGIATGIMGSRGNEVQVMPGTNSPEVIGGREYSGHALDRMQERGYLPSVVENTIRTGTASGGNSTGTTKYYDAVNNVSVIIDSATKRVVTVR